MKPKTLGYHGEDLAAHFLQSKGYEILAKNFTVRGGEIDLACRQGKTLVFVEIKTRRSETFGDGGESMNFMKRRRLLWAIDQFLLRMRANNDIDYRVDLIEIEMEPNSGRLKNIQHFEDIEL